MVGSCRSPREALEQLPAKTEQQSSSVTCQASRFHLQCSAAAAPRFNQLTLWRNYGLYRGHECVPVDKNFQKLKNDDDFACVSLYSHNCIFKKEESTALHSALDYYCYYRFMSECWCKCVFVIAGLNSSAALKLTKSLMKYNGDPV